jgi:hypothetical protein
MFSNLQGLRAICRRQDGKSCVLENQDTQPDDGHLIVDRCTTGLHIHPRHPARPTLNDDLSSEFRRQ